MAFQILVVDNQRETSKAIRAGIQSLGTEFSVATTLSGEEALLEARLRKFDLLISEVRLSGMSGVELVQKLRTSKPDLKVLLVSSTLDRYIRREAADIGVDNLLQKPLEISELLYEIKRVLGLGGESPAPTPKEEPEVTEPLSISDRLANLRQDLQASLALLLSGDTGEVLMQAGDLQPLSPEAEIPSLITAFSAGYKIGRLLGVSVPDNFYAFKGQKLDLIMTHVGDSHALLVGIPSSEMFLARMDQTYKIIHQGTHDLQTILADMGVALVEPLETELGEATQVVSSDEEEVLDEVFEVDVDLEALLIKSEKPSHDEDLDSFWEVSPVEDTGIFASADALSYEQARQLGLAPEDEK